MAKTYKDLYRHIYSFERLYAAFAKAARGKRYRPEVLRFSNKLEENLIQLQNELVWHTYKTGEYHQFYIYEPKKRVVSALPFRDRVMQHAIISAIEPIWESRFVYDSYACRPGKGTHRGVGRVQSFLRAVKRRHGRVYALKADISRYFASIDHGVLQQLLRKRISCMETQALLDGIIATTPGPAGIPLGNLTSQLFANIYLHELDEFVKYRLREKYYVRYMDDFVVVHHDKASLRKTREAIELFLREHLRLVTNAKTQIFPVATLAGRGLDFLGRIIWPTHIKLRKDSAKRIKRKLAKLQADYSKGYIPWERIHASIASWLGHTKHADSYRLQQKLLELSPIQEVEVPLGPAADKTKRCMQLDPK